MPNQGFIVNPVSYEDQETGQEVIQDFEVTGSASGEIARTNEVQHQNDRFVVGDDGETHYDNSVDEGDYQNLVSSYGGEEVYSQVETWAEQNFSPDEIAGYHEIVSRGDLNEIADAMELVYQTYNNRTGDEVAPVEETEGDEDPTANYVFSEIIPEADYERLITFAQENYDEEFISSYNTIMESNDREMIKKTIQLLMTKANEN